MSNKTAILFGTFDIVHQGHLNMFNQTKKLCNHLTIVIARDNTVFQIKKKYPIHSELARLNNVKKQNVADKVILGNLGDKYALINKHKPQIIFLGYDQTAFIKDLKSKLIELKLKNTKIIRLKPFKPEHYKTSKILNTHKSVGAIIRDKKNRILMIERAYFPFGWACPAGHIEENEKPEEALIREVQEETGLKVKTFELVTHEYVEWEKCSRGITGHDWYIYKVNAWEGKIKKNEEEVRSTRWMHINEIEKINLTKIWYYWFKELKKL